MDSGIYKITINNIYYIGSAKSFTERRARHMRDLRSKTHHNIILQRSYDKYGEECVDFEIIENVPYCENIIVETEQRYIDEYKSIYGNRCCNLSDATFGDVMTNHPNRDSIIKKRSESQRKTNAEMGPDGRKMRYSRPGESNGMFGKTHTEEVKRLSRERVFDEETRYKMSESAKRKFDNRPDLRENLSTIASARTGERNPFYGKTHSDETKKKISIKNKGKNPSNNVKISIDNVTYESYNDASRKLNIPVVTIRYRCLSDNIKFNNYIIL